MHWKTEDASILRQNEVRWRVIGPSSRETYKKIAHYLAYSYKYGNFVLE